MPLLAIGIGIDWRVLEKKSMSIPTGGIYLHALDNPSPSPPKLEAAEWGAATCPTHFHQCAAAFLAVDRTD